MTRSTPRALISLFRKVGHNFRVDSRSLVELKNAGAAEEVILAMVDCTVSTRPEPALLIAH